MLKPLHIGACALLAIAAGCGQHYKPDVSTETGNPPVVGIDSALIALVVTRDEVHVQGQPGAVTPPEASVEVTIRRTGDVIMGPVEDDGSFDVEVDATLDDAFEVRAVLDGDASDVVLVVRGGAMVIEGGGDDLTCEQQTEAGSTILASALETADQSCTTTDDCMPYWRSASCIASCFGGYYSAAGLASIADTVQSIDDGVCSTFEDDGCMLLIPPCVGPLPAACVDGQCVEDENPPDPAMCEAACNTSTISWRITSPGVLPALPSTEVFTLSGCTDLMLTSEGGKCITSVPQCSDDAGTASMESVVAAMQNRYVAAAFGAGETVGESEELAGYHYELTLNDETFTYRACGPMSSPDCGQNDPIATLVQELDRIGQQNHCDVQPDCDSAFDAGDCDAAFQSWWHDPKTGACLVRTYGGCGGNGNRYESEAACRSACPPPQAAGDCPPDRVFVEDICFDCGPIAQCLEPTNACLLACDSTAQCADEEPSMNMDQVCLDSGTCGIQLFCF